MRSRAATIEKAPRSPTRKLPGADHEQSQLSRRADRSQLPWLDSEEGIWKGCGFFFDGCSCPRCEEAERRNRLNWRICEALDLPQGQHSEEELREQLNRVLNGLAPWIERRGYVDGQDSEEGRQYVRLCEVLDVAPGMKHSGHYWELKLKRLLREVS